MDKKSEKYYAIWQDILSSLQDGQKLTNTFTERVAFDKVENKKFIIAATSLFTSNYFEKNYKASINQNLKELTGDNLKVEFVQKSTEYVDKLKKRTYSSEKNSKDFDESLDDEKENNEQDNNNALISTNNGTFNDNSFLDKKLGLNNLKAQKLRQSQLNSNLTQRYTFDSFIYGDNTTFTYNVAYAIAKNPGITYNPCLIYGGVGLGKTHLLQSIGNYICTNSKRLTVIYVTAETFTNEFISALKKNQIGAFKSKYRKVDVLLVDDIHFLQNKESTQEELFHTFNDLYETKRQMVFTCDRPLSELKNITDRLLSRFGRGMNIDLKPPTYETKFAILSKKSQEQNLELDGVVIDYLCLNINTNVRDLEAALMKLGAFAKFTKSKISLEKAQDLIPPSAKQLEQENVNFTVDEIIRATSEYYELYHYDLKSKKRTRKFVMPRQIAIYISRELTDLSTTEIGADFSRDHTTIMHSIEKIETAKKTNLQIQKDIREIEIKLKTMQR
jgi:chromosomal replication initiator protein